MISLSEDLGALEEVVYSGAWEAAPDRLFGLLQRLDDATISSELTSTPASEIQTICTRLSATVVALFASPGFELSYEAFVRLTYCTPTLAHLFRLSGFRSTDGLLAQIVRRTGGSPPHAFAGKSDARKFLLACSVYSRYFPRMTELVRIDPQALHAVYLRAFTVHITAEPLAQAHREQILSTTEHLQDVVPRTQSLSTLHHVWGLCSYMTTAGRHSAKQHLNRMFGNWMAQQGLAPAVTSPGNQGAEKPVLLVVCEVMSEAHVMYRCFAPFLRQLRQRFRVVGLIAREDLGDGGTDWCDDLQTFSRDELKFDQIVSLVARIAPCAIYYPCVGVQLWTVLLCNLRLAPLQFATLGHPATTHSPHMDAVVTGQEMLGDPACFSETVVVLRGPGHLFELRPVDGSLEPTLREHPSPLRIAVIANLLKLNSQFVQTCVRLYHRSGRPLEFHFFPNCVGLRWHVVRQQMQELLPGNAVHVHPRMPFERYRQTLNDCDIYLSPFPFGGENSMLDALLQGIPAVTLLGDEPHARLDARVMRLAGLPEWLITRNVDDYEQAALRLIDDDTLRCTLSQSLDARNIRTQVEQERQQFDTDFIDSVWWMFEHQEALRTSGRKVWTPEDRKSYAS